MSKLPNISKPTVIVTVRGGVADVAFIPKGVNVLIRDYDNGRDDPEATIDNEGESYSEQTYERKP